MFDFLQECKDNPKDSAIVIPTGDAPLIGTSAG